MVVHVNNLSAWAEAEAEGQEDSTEFMASWAMRPRLKQTNNKTKGRNMMEGSSGLSLNHSYNTYWL